MAQVCGERYSEVKTNVCMISSKVSDLRSGRKVSTQLLSAVICLGNVWRVSQVHRPPLAKEDRFLTFDLTQNQRFVSVFRSNKSIKTVQIRLVS